jgi:glutamate-5-semialdehyde dehydrogenase
VIWGIDPMIGPLFETCRTMASEGKQASKKLATLTRAPKDRFLNLLATSLIKESESILEANAKDIELAPRYDLNAAAIDRLRLSSKRIEQLAEGIRQVSALPDPIGNIREGSIRPNGLEVQKVSVPLGLIFFLYESRPNVTLDAAALCVKSGNAVILRGGKEAFHSNQAFAHLITQALLDAGLPKNAVQLVESLDREAVGHFLKMDDQIDLVIPRGGESLIRRVTAEATMPVLKHYHGNCHIYVDASADLDMAEKLIINSKCQRPGTCNALESLLVHRKIAPEFLPKIGKSLKLHGVELRVGKESIEWLPDSRIATEEDDAAEYLDLILSIRTVNDMDSAIRHIDQFGSKHSDAIVTQDWEAARRFVREVDSAAVLVNASTRFNDGFELGLGAEIGISTDKFHARGPCGLNELTTYKYVVLGEGQVRE